MKQECVNEKENEKSCPCSEIDCSRHGICFECISYHRKEGSLPACL